MKLVQSAQRLHPWSRTEPFNGVGIRLPDLTIRDPSIRHSQGSAKPRGPSDAVIACESESLYTAATVCSPQSPGSPRVAPFPRFNSRSPATRGDRLLTPRFRSRCIPAGMSMSCHRGNAPGALSTRLSKRAARPDENGHIQRVLQCERPDGPKSRRQDFATKRSGKRRTGRTPQIPPVHHEIAQRLCAWATRTWLSRTAYRETAGPRPRGLAYAPARRTMHASQSGLNLVRNINDRRSLHQRAISWSTHSRPPVHPANEVPSAPRPKQGSLTGRKPSRSPDPAQPASVSTGPPQRRAQRVTTLARRSPDHPHRPAPLADKSRRRRSPQPARVRR